MEITAKGIVERKKLPPTDKGAYFRGLRGYFQIITWKISNCHDLCLDPK